MKKKDSIVIKHSLFPLQEFEDEEENSWQVSYLDIITIVLGFLIILLSVSQITKSEFSSLSELFGRLADETEYFTTPIGNIQEELFDLLEPEIEAGNLEIIRDLNDLRVRFKSDDLYASGQASLQPGAEYLLDRVLIAMQMTSYNDFNIDVEGHTDNTPIASLSYPSNWELSTARAANVVKYFNDLGIPSKRLKASGYADSRPIIEYDSLGFPFAASKDKNRRVVLRLYYSTENLLEERQPEEEFDENILTESIEGSLPNLTPIDPNVESNILVLADEPAMVTLAEQNRIEQVQQEAVSNPPSQEPEIISQVPEPETLPVNNEPNSVEEEEITVPSQPEESPVVSNSTSMSLPSTIRVDARCEFSVQIGEYEALQTAFQQAARIESAIGAPVILTYNNQEYSVRTEAQRSFNEARSIQTSVSNQLNDADVGLVHQCYNNTISKPKPVKFLIQFGAYQNRSNAINFTMDLMDQFGVQAFMNRVSDTYNVLTGPYTSRDEVLAQLQAFRSQGVSSNLFIRHQPETVYNYSYAYQIEIGSFSSPSEAQNLAVQIQSNTGISTRVEELTAGTFSVMTGQSNSWNETQNAFNRIRNSGISTNPAIFFIESNP